MCPPLVVKMIKKTEPMLSKENKNLIYALLYVGASHQKNLAYFLNMFQVTAVDEIADWVVFFQEDEKISLTKINKKHYLQLTQKGLDDVAAFDTERMAKLKKMEETLSRQTEEITNLQKQLQAAAVQEEAALLAQAKEYERQIRQQGIHISVVYVLAFILFILLAALFLKYSL